MEKKDNKVAKKVNNLYNDFNIEEQSKDPYNDLRIIERSIRFILDLNFDIDRLRKPFIAFKPFNLKIKIFENALCIVTKNGIYIYSKDL